MGHGRAPFPPIRPFLFPMQSTLPAPGLLYCVARRLLSIGHVCVMAMNGSCMVVLGGLLFKKEGYKSLMLFVRPAVRPLA